MPAGTDDFDTDDEFGGEVDSKLVKDLRRQLKEKSKREEELASQLRELSGRERQRTLTETLTSKGLSAKAAKFYPADADLSEDAINAWVAENADVFGVKPAQAAEPTAGEPEASAASEPSGVDLDTVAAYRRIQAAQGSAVATSRDQDVLRNIQQATSPEELTAFLRTARA